MTVLDEDMTAFVRYRIEKAEEAYKAAYILYKNQQWNAAEIGYTMLVSMRHPQYCFTAISAQNHMLES